MKPANQLTTRILSVLFTGIVASPAVGLPLWLIAASTALLACHPSGDGRTRATPSAVASSAAASSSAGSESPPVAKPPEPEAEGDAGAHKESMTRVVCGRRAPPHCRFGGRVRTVRPAVLAPGDRPIDERDILEGATEVVLDDIAPLECTRLQLGGVRQASGEPGGPERREGPSPWLGKEMPVAREILVRLRPGLHLPFAEGELICGSVTVFRAGPSARASEAFIARPTGDILLADAASLPRDPSPTPGWTITFSPERSLRGPWRDYDMVVTHGGVSIQTPFEGQPALLRAPDGEFLVESSGYTRMEPLSDEDETHMGYLAKKGYSFSIVRQGP